MPTSRVKIRPAVEIEIWTDVLLSEEAAKDPSFHYEITTGRKATYLVVRTWHEYPEALKQHLR